MKKKTKTPKKNNKILKIIIILILCVGFGFASYFITYQIDKNKKGGDVKLTVTFDDTETYIIPSITKMSEEDAMKEWPYIINLENKGTGKGLYQILIKDAKDSTIKRDYLSYALYLGDKKVVSDELKNIKDNILYTYEIDGKTKQKYELYIWVSKDLPEESNEEVKEGSEENKEEEKNEKKETKYEYSLEFNTIKAGGPGF